MVEILCEQRHSRIADATAKADRLWLGREAIAAATGWDWKPEGLCRGDICVPLPRQTAAELVRDDKLDIAAMWAHMGHPVVHDPTSTVWVLGTGAQERAQALTSLQAPDFELPDLDGKPHRLSDYRGNKVFLATWASW